MIERDLRESGDADLVHHSAVRRFEQYFESRFENLRLPALIVFMLVSVFFAFHALQLRPDASFEKMVPGSHEFIRNFQQYENELRPLGNVIRVVVETRSGHIYAPEFLETLRKVTDEVFYIPGVDRGALKSLWTPNVLWNEVTEKGFVAGQIIPQGFDGSRTAVDQVRTNVARAGIIGTLVANDHRSAIVLAPLQEVDPKTGKRLDYAELSRRLEESVRDKYQTDDIRIHITGFAKIVGDLIEGASAIGIFFAITFGLTIAVLWF